jgi:hypothetical protein
VFDLSLLCVDEEKRNGKGEANVGHPFVMKATVGMVTEGLLWCNHLSLHHCLAKSGSLVGQVYALHPQPKGLLELLRSTKQSHSGSASKETNSPSSRSKPGESGGSRLLQYFLHQLLSACVLKS